MQPTLYTVQHLIQSLLATLWTTLGDNASTVEENDACASKWRCSMPKNTSAINCRCYAPGSQCTPLPNYHWLHLWPEFKQARHSTMNRVFVECDSCTYRFGKYICLCPRHEFVADNPDALRKALPRRFHKHRCRTCDALLCNACRRKHVCKASEKRKRVINYAIGRIEDNKSDIHYAQALACQYPALLSVMTEVEKVYQRQRQKQQRPRSQLLLQDCLPPMQFPCPPDKSNASLGFVMNQRLL